jgi:hypothetical protein
MALYSRSLPPHYGQSPGWRYSSYAARTEWTITPYCNGMSIRCGSEAAFCVHNSWSYRGVICRNKSPDSFPSRDKQTQTLQPSKILESQLKCAPLFYSSITVLCTIERNADTARLWKQCIKSKFALEKRYHDTDQSRPRTIFSEAAHKSRLIWFFCGPCSYENHASLMYAATKDRFIKLLPWFSTPSFIWLDWTRLY